MNAYAECALRRGRLRRPTEWAGPNGCGPGAARWVSRLLVPDELAGVEFGHECCDPHDLAYAVGGFWGLFYRKPRADVGLGACLVERFYDAAAARWYRGTREGRIKAVGTAVLGTALGPVYALAVLALGWTPLTWSWRKRRIDPEALELFAALAGIGTKEETR